MAGATTREAQHARRPFPLTTAIAPVVRVDDVSPQMRRVTLALEELPIEEPGEIITLLWPAAGEDLVLPETGWRFPPGVADRQHARNYTVRAWDPGSGELDIDFFLHGDLGRAARWAESVTVGHAVGIAGPRVHWTTEPGYDWTLLVADETGLPALAAIAAEQPDDQRTICVIEVADAAEEQPLRDDAIWLHRGEAPPGTTTLLADTVAALELPAGAGRAWGGLEASAARAVRDHLRTERGLADVTVLGYWKHRNTEEWD
jgi:NADPH-dependent ferric siderophore reductase